MNAPLYAILWTAGLGAIVLAFLAWTWFQSASERRLLLERVHDLEYQALTIRDGIASSGGPVNEVADNDTVEENSSGPFNPDDVRAPPPLVVPKDLVEACARGGTVLFIGSADLIRDKAPSRAEFLRSVAARSLDAVVWNSQSPSSIDESLARLLRRDDLDAATDLLEERVGRDVLLSVARDVYRGACPTPELERLCRDADIDAFVSLDFDPAAAIAVGVEGTRVLTARASENFEKLMTEQGRFLLQLAGVLDQPGTVCLTLAQLKANLAETPDLRSALLSMLAARTILFVGLSAQVIETLWDALGVYGAATQKHYALMHGDPDFDLMADRFRARYNVELLEIENRAGLGAFADKLARRVADRRRDVAVEEAAGPTRASLLQRLTLQNIGPFTDATVEFSPSWTVILGNNGAGKSTILRAVALILAGTDREAQLLAGTLLRRGQKFGTIELVVDAVPHPVTYRAQITVEGDRVNVSTGVSPLQAGTLPAFGFSAVRGVTLPMVMEPTSPADNPVPRVSDVLPLLRGGPDTRVLDLKAWIRQTFAIQQNASLPEHDRKRATEKLGSFFKVVDEMAPGFELRFSRCDSKGEILLATSDGEIPMAYVSQGMTSMIGWLGTLIQRLYEIGEADADPRQTSALVLVDEIDSHLHPEWQQRIVPTLRSTFPRLQVIATTHSALMVGSLEKGEVIKVSRAAGRISVEQLNRSYKGFRVDQILTDPPFDMASTRDLDWEALRAEYADLLGISNRDEAQDARYRELDALMDKVPPPYEERDDRAAFEEARQRVDEEMAQASQQSAGPQ